MGQFSIVSPTTCMFLGDWKKPEESHMNTRGTCTERQYAKHRIKLRTLEKLNGNATHYAHTHHRIDLTFIARGREVIHEVTKKIIQLCKEEKKKTKHYNPFYKLKLSARY